MSARKGTVYLVGAGPGDPGLITVRGLELLRTCDVVLHDRLVAPELLAKAPSDAELIFVGKRPGEVHSRQVVADALLISKAKENLSVVRLKGGDPFVFGRGGEEARLLASSGIPFEIVPGVSSAIAVPAYAGIPVTERGQASSFAVLTGREEPDAPIDDSPLTIGVDTVVLLMGATALAATTKRLLAGGSSPDAPAAAIQWGTTSSQRTVVARLGELGTAVRDAGLQAPITTIIGNTVATRDAIEWFESRPLLGRTVVVTRAARDDEVQSLLTDLGARVIHFPVIAVEDPPDWADLDGSLKALAAGDYQWVIFASVNAVDKTFGRLSKQSLDARAFATARIAAVGPATVSALARAGLVADFVPDEARASRIAESLGSGPGRILWPRAEEAPAGPVEILRNMGWDVDEVTGYRTVAGDPHRAAREEVAGGYDCVVFTSGSTVTRFLDIAGSPPDDAAIVCIGPETAARAADRGLEVRALAAEPTPRGLVAAVREALLEAG